MSRYLLGMDCGGTRIQAIAYSLDGQVLAKKEGGASNLVVHYENSKNEMKKVIQAIQHELSGMGCQFALLGIAGLDSGGFKETLQQDLKEDLNEFSLINDGQLAYWNRLEGQEGILVVAGTGSVVTGYFDQTWQRVGGWGHLLGDEGSAYWIAQQAVKGMLSKVDQGLEQTQLDNDLLQSAGVDSPMSFVKKFYQLSKPEIANFAQIVALNHTEEARTILLEAGELLAKQVLMLAKRYPRENYQIGLNGSVLEKNDIVLNRFNEILQAEVKVEIRQINEPNARGVLFYSMID